MSRFRKSLTRTGENLKFSGSIVISPWIYGKKSKFFRPPAPVIGFDPAFGLPILLAAMATSVTLIAGAVHATGSVLVGILDMGYSVCADCIVEETPNNEQCSSNTQSDIQVQPYIERQNSHAIMMETLTVEAAPNNEQFSTYTQSHLGEFKNKKLFEEDGQEQALYWEEEHPQTPLLG